MIVITIGVFNVGGGGYKSARFLLAALVKDKTRSFESPRTVTWWRLAEDLIVGVNVWDFTR